MNAAFDSWPAFFAMGGYAFYVWLAVAVTLISLLGLVAHTVWQRRQLLAEIGRRQAREQKADRATADGKQSAMDAAADPAQAATELKQWFERVKQSGEPTLSAADKDALVNIVAARTGKSRDEASQIVDNYAQAYQQAVQKVEKLKAEAEQKAREAADEAAKQLSRAAWGSLLILLLGAALSAGVGRIAESTRRIVAVS